MSTRRATFPCLGSWLKHAHLHQRRRDDKGRHWGPHAASVSADSDTPNKRLQAHRAAPLPRHKVSQISGVQARDLVLFTPESDAPLGFIETHLSVLSGSKTEQGGGGVWA